MSAESLRPASPRHAEAAAEAEPDAGSAASPQAGTDLLAAQLRLPVGAAIEPSLVNRLLGVAAAVFAVPVAIELRRAFAVGALGPTPQVEAWIFGAAVALVVAFALVLRRASGLRALRAGRVLCVALALESAVLGAALASQLAR